MTQNELIYEISDRTNMNEEDVRNVINTMKNIIMEKLLEKKSVTLHQFCKFGVKFVKSRNIIAFGENKTIPDRMRPFTIFAPSIKNFVNKE